MCFAGRREKASNKANKSFGLLNHEGNEAGAQAKAGGFQREGQRHKGASKALRLN
jgi:hypothetical protein